MNLLFNTFSTIIIGALFGAIYTLVLYRQKRLSDANLIEFGTIFFSFSSIISGIKLIYTTCNLLNETIIESDKIYTIYGGFLYNLYFYFILLKKIKPTKPQQILHF